MTAATTISAASLGRIAELQARLRELANISRALAKSKRRYVPRPGRRWSR